VNGGEGDLIFYDTMAAEYSQHRKVHPEVLRDLVSESGIDHGCRVLEVGCGTGNYVTALQSATRCSCWGVDPSSEMLAAAQERSESVTFQLGRAERLEFSADFFDLVFSVDVIHHLEDITAYFQEVQRVLKPGGRVCTVTDSDWIIRRRQPLAVYFPETVEVDLERYPRMEELRAAMQSVGLEGIVEHQVEFPYELVDAQAYRDKAFSSLHLIPDDAWKRGLERLESDLRSGPVPCVSRYVLFWGSSLATLRHTQIP
jgi:ubiquinone/menaquinone biosynthesis C-methylase UbiE